MLVKFDLDEVLKDQVRLRLSDDDLQDAIMDCVKRLFLFRKVDVEMDITDTIEIFLTNEWATRESNKEFYASNDDEV